METKNPSRQARIEKIIHALNEGMYERREQIAVSLLAALSGQNIFLLGPPGTAKSLLARRLALAFKFEKQPFEYLMQRFSTPEEIFGPVSISELKEDKYVRKTEGFLPTAHFAFLDEIWKSSPAILNTLLTIINEKVFRNGTTSEEVPLQALIAASNETPPTGQGLEALYDRFIVRILVPPMQEDENFKELLKKGGTDSSVKCDISKITPKELKEWREDINKVQLSDETMDIIKDIKMQLSNESAKEQLSDEDSKVKSKNTEIYISDRRWQKATMLLKSAAFFCERNSTNLVDTFLLMHCLWTTEKNRNIIIAVVEEAVEKCGFKTDIIFANIVEDFRNKEHRINEHLYHDQDVYQTVILKDKKEYLRDVVNFSHGRNYNVESEEYYIPIGNINTEGEFNPVDKSGNAIKRIVCDFKNSGSYTIRVLNRHICDNKILKEENEPCDVTPKFLIHKGAKKDVDPLLINAFKKEVEKISKKFEQCKKEIEKRKLGFEAEIETPFVSETMRNIAIKGVNAQLDDLRLKIKDCERLMELIGE